MKGLNWMQRTRWKVSWKTQCPKLARRTVHWRQSTVPLWSRPFATSVLAPHDTWIKQEQSSFKSQTFGLFICRGCNRLFYLQFSLVDLCQNQHPNVHYSGYWRPSTLTQWWLKKADYKISCKDQIHHKVQEKVCLFVDSGKIVFH